MATTHEVVMLDQLLQSGWTKQERPAALFRRFHFAGYGATRRFLDEVARLQEQLGIAAQNISFGTTYVNVTILLDENDERPIVLAHEIGTWFAAQTPQQGESRG